MGSYIYRFTQVSIEVDKAQEGFQCWILENSLLSECPFMKNLGKMKGNSIQEMLTMDEPLMILDEKLTMHFSNPTSCEYHSASNPEKSLTDVRIILTKTCKRSMTDIPY